MLAALLGRKLHRRESAGVPRDYETYRKIESLLSPTESDRLRVVLVNTRNPLNIGAVARAMSNFGFSRLRVVNPFAVAFKEARSAVGASHVLAAAEQYRSVSEAVADCALVVGTTAVRHRELRHPLRSLDGEAGGIIREQLQSAPVGLLFGSEKVGLSNQDLSYCHWLIQIPTREEHISMNLGQAAAVCLFELSRTAAADEATKPCRAATATAAEVERLTQPLLEALTVSGYIKERTADSTEERVRRLILRLGVQSSDADVLLGMLRQILWKLKSE